LTSTYLSRLNQRNEHEDLKTNVIFGLAFGWVLTLMGAFHYFFLIDGDRWCAVFYAGLTFLACTLVVPFLVGYPRKAINKVGGAVATFLFRIILGLTYFLVVLPTGLVFQKVKGTDPFYSWDEAAPANAEGWVDKDLTSEASVRAGGEKKMPLILQPLKVVNYFATRGQVFLVPSLLFLMVFTLVGVFVQNTALAPLIYTLF